MNDQEIEKEIQDKGLNAPRLTPRLIEEKIVKSEFHVFDKRLTVCCLNLLNGFVVMGESSCVSPENYDKEMGENIAFENAKNKIWMLEGYLLKQKLHDEPSDFIGRLRVEISELTIKTEGLAKFMASPQFSNIDNEQADLMDSQGMFMMDYLEVLLKRLKLLAND